MFTNVGLVFQVILLYDSCIKCQQVFIRGANTIGNVIVRPPNLTLTAGVIFLSDLICFDYIT